MIPLPTAELERLAAVRRYDVLDTPPDGAFDRITALAARLFGVPIALVTIVDEDRIWFKSRHGLDANVVEIPREPGLCASAIIADVPYIVESARTDPRTLANPLVAGEFGLQFYAAAPLKTSDGYRLGTLCVIDREPRSFSPDEAATLESLAAIVVDELELRLSVLRTVASERAMRRAAARLADENARLYQREHHVATLFQEASLPQHLPRLPGLDLDAVYIPGSREAEVGGDWYDALTLPDGRLLLSIGDVAGHGLISAVAMSHMRQAIRGIAHVEQEPAAILDAADRALRAEHPETYVSAVVGVFDRTARTFVHASAGHPPPYLRHPDGTVEPLAAHGVLLGVRTAGEGRASTAPVPDGALLVLYTDGLTEAGRDRAAGEGSVEAALRDDEIARAERPARALHDAILATRRAHDDVAILTLRVGAVGVRGSAVP